VSVFPVDGRDCAVLDCVRLVGLCATPPGEEVRRGRRGLLEGIPVAALEPREFRSGLFL
jgi:hypothetical protein